jgi:hypothetical protein
MIGQISYAERNIEEHPLDDFIDGYIVRFFFDAEDEY